ncbi:hypothetical protein D8674_000282 [Pyrus ussuriensis x Pyrus communis]|uniref:Uncharacterized protein n=1 Tax=Pyrus ussuriensis x Pyrus communis TaxID=2448454 RepID=A0A5N5F854_9ROSA|nr:hypothetical protein D8674_000282 [Pyrus ussuriensis x Pyrus communis]
MVLKPPKPMRKIIRQHPGRRFINIRETLHRCLRKPSINAQGNPSSVPRETFRQCPRKHSIIA